MANSRKRLPRAILLDLDGVLWFSNEAHRHAFQKALERAGYPWTVSKKLFSRVAGFTTEKAFSELFRLKRLPIKSAMLKKLSLEKRKWVGRYLWTEPRLATGLKPFLKRIRQTHRVAMVTSSHPQTPVVFFSRSRTRKLFDLVLTSGNVPTSKPSPKIYQAALRAFKIKPSQALAVEDTPTGVKAAHRAGIPVLGMRGSVPPEALRKAGAFAVILRLSEAIPHATNI